MADVALALETPATGLRAAASRALRWSVAARLAVQIVSWASTLIVIRLLSPEDYGLMAMVMIVVSFAAMFEDFGLAAAVVRAPSITNLDLKALSAFNIVFNLGVFLLVVASAPLVSVLFAADLTLLIATVSVTLLFSCVAAMPEALLIRRFAFRRRSAIEAVAALAGGLATVAMAIAGAGVWSLVVGQVIQYGLRAAGFWFVARDGVGWTLDWLRAAPHLVFGTKITLQRILWWAYLQVDILLLGYLGGAKAVGVYAVAKNLAFLPSSKLGSTLNQIALTTFAKVQGDPTRLAQAIEQSIQMLAVAVFPTFWLISALAPELQQVVLGPTWTSAVDPLRVLSVVVPIQLIATQLGQALNAAGQAGIVLRNSVLLLAAVALGTAIGAAWGADGVAVGWAAGYVISAGALAFNAQHLLKLRATTLGRVLLPPVFAATAMYVGIEWLRPQLSSAPLVDGLALGTFGVVVYLAVAAIVARRPMLHLCRFIIGRE